MWSSGSDKMNTKKLKFSDTVTLLVAQYTQKQQNAFLVEILDTVPTMTVEQQRLDQLGITADQKGLT